MSNGYPMHRPGQHRLPTEEGGGGGEENFPPFSPLNLLYLSLSIV